MVSQTKEYISLTIIFLTFIKITYTFAYLLMHIGNSVFFSN